jgi:hypothetical protein
MNHGQANQRDTRVLVSEGNETVFEQIVDEIHTSIK